MRRCKKDTTVKKRIFWISFSSKQHNGKEKENHSKLKSWKMATTVKKSLELRSCQKCHNGKEEKNHLKLVVLKWHNSKEKKNNFELRSCTNGTTVKKRKVQHADHFVEMKYAHNKCQISFVLFGPNMSQLNYFLFSEWTETSKNEPPVLNIVSIPSLFHLSIYLSITQI